MTNEYQLDQQIGYVLRLASQRHAGIFQRSTVHGLTPTQFSTLIRIDEFGVCSQNKLGRLAAMDVATIKGVVDRLRKKGMVSVSCDPTDKRRSLISLTEKAQKILPELRILGQGISEDTLAPLTSNERKTILKLLMKIS